MRRHGGERVKIPAPIWAAALPVLAVLMLVITLAPGAYTAVVSGVGNTAGIALVEVYEIP